MIDPAGAIAFEKHFILIAKTIKIYSDHCISETMDTEVSVIKNELSTWRPEADKDVFLCSFYDTIVLEMIENILQCIVQWFFFQMIQMILLIILHYPFPFSSHPMRFWSLLWERFRPTEAEETQVDDFMTYSWESPYWRLIFNKTVKGCACQKPVVLVQIKQHQNGNELWNQLVLQNFLMQCSLKYDVVEGMLQAVTQTFIWNEN